MPVDTAATGVWVEPGTSDGQPLRVGIVAPPRRAPDAPAGCEVVVDLLAAGLHAAGHEPVLFVVRSDGGLVRHTWVDELVDLTDAYDTLRDCDVVHDHTLCGPFAGAART